jgi:hypothetical protein
VPVVPTKLLNVVRKFLSLRVLFSLQDNWTFIVKKPSANSQNQAIFMNTRLLPKLIFDRLNISFENHFLKIPEYVS